jgi:hypothetical protein
MEGMKEGRIEVTGRRCTKLLYNLKDKTGYWKLKEKSLDCTVENMLWKWLWNCPETDDKG